MPVKGKRLDIIPIALALSLFFVLNGPGGPISSDAAGTGSGLEIFIWTNSTTMTWPESRDITISVVWNASPVQNATVALQINNNGRPETQDTGVTDVNGEMKWTLRGSAYRDHATIIANVSYMGQRATNHLNVTITDPPPTVIPGKDPREPGGLGMLWAASMVIAVMLFGVFLAAGMRRKIRMGP